MSIAGKHLSFEPRIREGTWLRESSIATAMIDVSDGLAGDAGHLARRSEVAVTIELEKLILDAGVAEAAERAGDPGAVFAAAGGEDYELLVAMPPLFGASEADACREDTGVALTLIGRAEAGEGVHVLLDGHPLDIAGFDHFDQ